MNEQFKEREENPKEFTNCKLTVGSPTPTQKCDVQRKRNLVVE